MLIFVCLYCLRHLLINMDIVAKNVFYMYKKVKTDYMHGFLLLASACIYFAKTAGSTRAWTHLLTGRSRLLYHTAAVWTDEKVQII